MSLIVVTGGAGFIGSNLLARLEARALAQGGGGELVVVDYLGSGDKWRNLAKRELAAIVAPENLPDFLAANRDEIEVIFHIGANSATTASDVDRLIDSNIRNSLMLWEWCAGEGKRLIYASSAATYGDGAQGFDDDGSPAALAKLRPLNAYGWSKHFVDRRIARLIAQGAPQPVQWAGLKYFNVYGPNEYHKGPQRSVAHQLFPLARDGQAARLFRSHRPDYPDGGQLRDFVWVEDCVDVMLWLLDHPEISGLFNLGTGSARSFADLATAVFRAVGVEPRIEFVDTPIEIRDKYQYFTQAKMERLRAAGYAAPFTSLEDGVASYIRDYLLKDDPYR